MKIFFISILISFLSIASASSVIGFVQKVDGNVKVKSEGSLKKSKVKVGFEIQSGDMITTSKKGSVVLKLVDASVIVLDSSSNIYFKTPSDAEQTEGSVYYKITSRNAKHALKIKTPFAIIGIKGTTFIINAKEDASVMLEEGLIGIQSIKEEFKLYRKGMNEKFNNYQDKQNSGFKDFKDKSKKAAAEITKEFDLQAGNRVSFSDNDVNEKSFSSDDTAEFQRFKKMMEIK